jgi:hypothetical protein
MAWWWLWWLIGLSVIAAVVWLAAFAGRRSSGARGEARGNCQAPPREREDRPVNVRTPPRRLASPVINEGGGGRQVPPGSMRSCSGPFRRITDRGSRWLRHSVTARVTDQERPSGCLTKRRWTARPQERAPTPDSRPSPRLSQSQRGSARLAACTDGRSRGHARRGEASRGASEPSCRAVARTMLILRRSSDGPL